MVEVSYQTRFYSDDEIKEIYLEAARREDLRAFEKDFVDGMLNKDNLQVRRKCYRRVSMECDKEVTVHYEAHKKVEETTGYTITRRVDVMNLVDYKVSENTKNVTYTSSHDYTKKFYNVSQSYFEWVDENFHITDSTKGRGNFSTEMPDAYKGVEPWAGLTYEMKKDLDTSSGCSSQISDCRKDVYESAANLGYTVDSVKFKRATVSNVVPKDVTYGVSYFVDYVYGGTKYTFEVFDEESGYVDFDESSFPKSRVFEERVENGIKEAKKIKNKAKRITIPTIIIGSIGILFTIVGTFMLSYFPMIIASLVFNIWYFWWVGCRLFKDVDEKIKELKQKLEYGKFVDNVNIPKIPMTSLIIKSLLLTLFNLLCYALPFVGNF